ncbi:alpha/beta-hydrolase [Dothidotthia symphoricarpi CBS 119687]|uniref:Alpha/beta-hydrolase n=1 Tax=Dothidotthia symphoricarpi CBS 119687 TaxID=1392245 RepID=A0A6A6AVS0_9PLEO|nr:alpha/beta-hydrolase [Dothidotthia symphoricarpi CBS 119687]KAF2134937.1 alpha/beta-hydrolase [Dothidotthia symphoricarpi CBS 119687]
MASKRTPGILYVTMQPKEGLPEAQFHDWYQNEHGPNRLRLPFCNNGFRYRASDLASQAGTKEQPEWMAIYDFDELEWLTREEYTRLRAAPVQSQRERDTMKQIFVDRRSYDLLKEWKGDDFADLQEVQSDGRQNVLIAVSFNLHDGEGMEDELRRWYEDEHVPLLMKVPGWRRSRRFETSYLDLQSGHAKQKEYLALHEYAPENGLADSPEITAATTTPWCEKIYGSVVKNRKRRVYNWYYTFGAAQRDLLSLESDDTLPSASTDGLTRTYPAHASPEKRPLIQSYITTADGVQIPYRLEGATDPNAPLLVLSNCILVDHTIWDDFVAHFLKLAPAYRILRYDARGRNALPPSSTSPVTVDVLAADIIALLDALRAKTASLIGVSLGGATVLNTALTHPNRISSFIACDTNAFAPPSNAQAWLDRVAMCEAEAALSPTREPIVGEQLAEITTRRWFVPASYDDADLAPKLAHAKELVKTNSLPGFRDGVKALHAYDLREGMAGFKGKGAFLVGAQDGVLPKSMRENMAEKLGAGVELKVIDGAGHLPMVERPAEVAGFAASFLG